MDLTRLCAENPLMNTRPSVPMNMQSFLKHKDAKPLRDVLASNPSRFVPLLVPAGTAAAARPGSPSTTTARLDLQFHAIKVPQQTHEHKHSWHCDGHAHASTRSRTHTHTHTHVQTRAQYKLFLTRARGHMHRQTNTGTFANLFSLAKNNNPSKSTERSYF